MAPPGSESCQRLGSSMHVQNLDRLSRATEAGGDSPPPSALFVQKDETNWAENTFLWISMSSPFIQSGIEPKVTHMPGV